MLLHPQPMLLLQFVFHNGQELSLPFFHPTLLEIYFFHLFFRLLRLYAVNGLPVNSNAVMTKTLSGCIHALLRILSISLPVVNA